MSPRLRFLKPAAIIFVLLSAAFQSYPQQLDQTFGGSPFFGSRYFFYGWNVFLINVDGIKAFRRPDNSIVFLARNTGVSGKGPSTNTISTAFFSPDGNSPLTHSNQGANNLIAVDAELQPDGDVATVGNSGSADIFVERFDLSGPHGLFILSFGSNINRGTNIAIQADGKMVVSGTSSNVGVNLTVVVRLNPDGSFDPTFGPYGNGILDIYDNAVLSHKLAIRPDGKILLAGNYIDGPETVSMFYLLNSDGSPDNSFGDGGLAYTVDTGFTLITDMNIQPDGKAVTLANRKYGPDGTSDIEEQDTVLRRLNQNGSIDTGFGVSGATVTNISPPTQLAAPLFDPSGTEDARNLIIESTGNIVTVLQTDQVIPGRTAGGSSPYNGRLERRSAAYLLRYNPSGRLIGKNISGRTKYNELFSPRNPWDLRGGFEQPGKGIVIYGNAEPGAGRNGFLARFSTISAVSNANNFFDYNYDGQAEFATYRPGLSGFSTWQLGRTQTRRSGAYEAASFDFGIAGDTPVPGDYDGDGIQDLAVFRNATGDWFNRKIYLNNCAPMGCTEQVHFGLPGDLPAPGDFDGDGTSDRAVFRPSEGNWYILFSSGGYTGLHFGQNGDLPVTGDYDNDGRSDVAVIRRENGSIIWYVLQSSNSQFIGIQFGLDSDKAVPADYTGDGRTEIAVWRPSEGNWYTLSNYTDFSAAHWGIAGDIPEPADYDGDGQADFAIYRPSEETHYARGTHIGNLITYHSGTNGTIPIPSVYIR
jgi:uncharacterized delta-60 repeat protein